MGVGALSGPLWTWHAHPVPWVLVAGLVALHVGRSRRAPQSARRPGTASFVCALLLLYVFLDWPVADLADRSLFVHMTQQTVLLLAVPPLLLRGLRPLRLPRRATRAVDGLLSPAGATIVFNLVVVTSFLPTVMDGAVGQPVAGAALDVGLLAAGAVMWTPALRVVADAGRPLRQAGRAGFLIIQSVLPSFASLIFIFDRHPVYPVFRDAARTIGLSPLADQQLAGVLAKVVGLAVLLGAAGAILLRGDAAGEDHLPAGTLTWDDVERELRRLEDRTGPG